MAHRSARIARLVGAVMSICLVGAVWANATRSPLGAVTPLGPARSATISFTTGVPAGTLSDVVTEAGLLPKVAPSVTDDRSETALYQRAIALSSLGRSSAGSQAQFDTAEATIDADAVTARLDGEAATAAARRATSAAARAAAATALYAHLDGGAAQADLRLYAADGRWVTTVPVTARARRSFQTATGRQGVLDDRLSVLGELRAETALAASATTTARSAAARAAALLVGERAAVGRLAGRLVTSDVGDASAVLADHMALVAEESDHLTSAAALQFTPTTALPAPVSTTAVALTWAFAELGRPYLYAATGPDSFDCSGLMQYVWSKAGVSIPRVAADQDAWADPVPLSQLLPGDLVFFGTSYIHHVGMYIGGGLMINAPHTGTVVQVSSIWWSDLAGFGRVHADGTPTASHQLPTAVHPAPRVVKAHKPVPSQHKPATHHRKPVAHHRKPATHQPKPPTTAVTTTTTTTTPSPTPPTTNRPTTTTTDHPTTTTDHPTTTTGPSKRSTGRPTTTTTTGA